MRQDNLWDELNVPEQLSKLSLY